MSHLAPTRDQRDQGFTLIEVIVSIGFMMLILIVTGSAIVQGQVLQRETTSLDRARMIAEQVLSRTDSLAVAEIAHYKNDGVATTYTPPPSLCSAGTYCNAVPTVIQPTNRPITNALVPVPVTYWTYDGTAADATAGLAKRYYTATMNIVTTSDTYYNPIETAGRRIYVTVTWDEGGRTRSYSAMRNRNQVVRRCDGTKSGSFYTGCYGLKTTTPTTGTSWVPGTYSADNDFDYNTDTGTTAYLVPAKLSGTSIVNDGPMTFYYQADDQTKIGSYPSAYLVTSVTVTLFDGSIKTMTKDGTGRWVYTQTAATVFKNVPLNTTYNVNNVIFTITYSTGTNYKATMAVRPMYYSSVQPTVTGVNGAALPKASGSPTGSLYTGVTVPAATNPTGTVTPYLCTKTDGTLWANQKFYFEMKNSNGKPDAVRYIANRADSAATGVKSWRRFETTNGQDDDKVLLKERLISGTETTNTTVNTTRYSVLFPTQVTADAQKSPHVLDLNAVGQYEAPRFFMKNLTLFIEDTRESDHAKISAQVSIPVRRAATAATCSTGGLATQPTY